MCPTAEVLLPNVTLVLGGARSGKSAYAEALVESAAGVHGRALYLATAEARDDEMWERIRRHRARRGECWDTVEEPLELAWALRRSAAKDHPVLVDCLTLWLSNIMSAGRSVDAETDNLIDGLSGLAAPVVFVSNEVGLGLVPSTAVGRAFRDHAGRLNQRIAAAADRVVFVAAGLSLPLKETRT